MDNSVEKFDPSTLMQGVKDRIKSTFVSLIPDEQWDQMVKSEVENFFKEKLVENYQRKEYISNFQILVLQQLQEESRTRLKKYLDSPEFQIIWDINGQPIANKSIEKMFIDNSGQILANFFGGIFTQSLAQLNNNIGRY